MLVVDAESRITADCALKHSWIQVSFIATAAQYNTGGQLHSTSSKDVFWKYRWGL